MNEKNHIDEERLAELAAGLGAPDSGERRHLEACPSCARELEELQDDLRLLGHLARESAPPWSAPLPLPECPAPARPRRVHRADPMVRRQRMFAGFTLVAAAAAFMLTLVGRNYHPEQLPEPGPAVMRLELQSSLEQDMRFMAEVRALERSPLPEMVTDLIGESDSGFEDNGSLFFMEDEPVFLYEDDDYSTAAAS